jgi:hypothetical protein
VGVFSDTGSTPVASTIFIAMFRPNQLLDYATREWHVALTDNSLTVEERYARTRDPLPFAAKLQPQQISDIGDRGDRHVLKVSDGWLVGYDDGKLKLINRVGWSGSETKQFFTDIGSGNVRSPSL